MKQVLLITTVLIFLINGYSQDYHPIVKETNNWSVVSGGLGAILKVCCVKTNHYKFEGDTSIQTIDYKKILSSTDSTNPNWETIGFIREDKAQKKVWLRNLENEEGLVYDFDLTLGKEITMYNPFYWETYTYEVTRIDSILLQTEYRKVYTLKYSTWEEIWIEGIGSEFGIVNSNILGLNGGFRELLCFSNNKNQYTNPKYQACHKTSFSPLITDQSIDNAVINQAYNYQINTTEIFDFDSISYFLSGSWLPAGLSLDKESGLISGIPSETGTFHLFICVLNNGFVTDYLETDLIVRNYTALSLLNSNDQVICYPNPSKGILRINCQNYPSNYSVVIRDLNGKQLLYYALINEFDRMNIENLTEGIYLISIYEKESGQLIKTDKLIVE